MNSFFVKKKTLIIESAVLIIFLAGMYYVYTMFTVEDATTTTATANEELLGQNFVLFLKAVNNDKLSFRDLSFLDSDLVKQLQDHSQTIDVNDTRGRVDPFVPYASTRPLR